MLLAGLVLARSMQVKILLSARASGLRRAIGTMNFVSTSAIKWLVAYSEQLGIDAPNGDECEQILALAGIAAHASERTAAPVACWLAAKTGLTADEARELALRIVVPDSDVEEDSM